MDLALAAIFGTSFAVGLSGAMTPGPLFTYDVSEAARRGFWTGPQVALGHSLLELLVVGGLALGLGPLLSVSLVGVVVGLAGGAFLVWMGYRMARSAPHQTLSVRSAGGNPGMRPVVAGVLVSLANPYWSVWWISIGMSYVFLSLQQGAAGLLAFYTGHILADFAWFSLVAFLVVSGRRFLNDRAYRGLLFVCALFLVSLGVFFIYNAAASWLG